MDALVIKKLHYQALTPKQSSRLVYTPLTCLASDNTGPTLGHPSGLEVHTPSPCPPSGHRRKGEGLTVPRHKPRHEVCQTGESRLLGIGQWFTWRAEWAKFRVDISSGSCRSTATRKGARLERARAGPSEAQSSGQFSGLTTMEIFKIIAIIAYVSGMHTYYGSF